MGTARVQFVALPGGACDSIAWRLLGANNRELGRSAATFAGQADCRRAVLELLARLDACHTSVSAGPRNSAWSWRLDLDGLAVATASRTYQRQRECEYNLERFLSALPAAVTSRPAEERADLVGELTA